MNQLTEHHGPNSAPYDESNLQDVRALAIALGVEGLEIFLYRRIDVAQWARISGFSFVYRGEIYTQNLMIMSHESAKAQQRVARLLHNTLIGMVKWGIIRR